MNQSFCSLTGLHLRTTLPSPALRESVSDPQWIRRLGSRAQSEPDSADTVLIKQLFAKEGVSRGGVGFGGLIRNVQRRNETPDQSEQPDPE